MIWLAVAFGGALGAVLRLGVRVGEQHWLNSPEAPAAADAIGFPLPLATLVVNLVGSVAIGAFLALTMNREPNYQFDAFFVTGLLGGFTTFSTFSREVVQLAVGGSLGAAAVYALLGSLVPILGAFAGFWMAR